MDLDGELSDAELERQAMAADPDVTIPADAEPFAPGDPGAGLLPEWYMPATLRGPLPGDAGWSRVRRRRAWLIGAVVAALLIVNGAGLCVTYGFPEIAW